MLRPGAGAAALLLLAGATLGQLGPGHVRAHQKISETAGGFAGSIETFDHFGGAVASLGDVDGDGVGDLAVGVPFDDAGSPLQLNHGAVWVLLLNADGTVKSEQRIAEGVGGFTGILGDADEFGSAVVGVGDLDGNGVPDLAVGARGDADTGTSRRGAVWLLFLRSDGTVASSLKINETIGGFDGELDDSDEFGSALVCLGDVDGNGVADLAVGAPGDDDGGMNRGAVWLLLLESSGFVADQRKIADGTGGFEGRLDDLDRFGASVAGWRGGGDVWLAVGAPGDDDGGEGSSADLGAVWLVRLDDAGSAVGHRKISAAFGDFPDELSERNAFGSSVASLGDLDGDGNEDLAVGAGAFADGGAGRGAVWLLFLNAHGAIRGSQRISDTQGSFGGVLRNGDHFGSALTRLGDLDGDGVGELAVGARFDRDGGPFHGAVWVLFLRAARWTDVGDGHPGSQGVPFLAGRGTLVADAPVDLTLTGALANAPALLVIGSSAAGLPLKDGVLVPDPESVATGLATDDDGAMSLHFRWPAGAPEDDTTWFQAWIVDPGASAGFAASNGLSATTP